MLDLSGPNTIIYFAFEHRWSDVEKFFLEEVNPHFKYEVIDHKFMDSKYQYHKIDIYKFRRK